MKLLIGSLLVTILLGFFITQANLVLAAKGGNGRRPPTSPATSPVTSPTCKPGFTLDEKNHCRR